MAPRTLIITGLLMVAFLGCERDIPVSGFQATPINGYRIEGTITDGLKRPLIGVSIRLFYDPTYMNSDSVPSREFAVQGTNLVRALVYNSANQFIKLLFSETVSDTTITVLWDQTNDQGAPVPSGLYSVQYRIGTETKKSYNVIVDGNITATTDSSGFYVVSETNLPIGNSVPYFDGSTFLGWYSLIPSVFLEIDTPSLTRTYHIALEKDAVTEFSLIIE